MVEVPLVVPSLFSLCVEAVTTEIIQGNPHLEEIIFELPSDIFDSLTKQLPPLALHKLQQQLDISLKHCPESINDGFTIGRKRGRYGDFNTTWKILFKTRWPERGRQSHPVDHLTKQGVVGFQSKSHSSEWHQMYWEAHIQDCLDEAAGKAVLPSFNRCIGAINIPGSILKLIGHKKCLCGSTCAYSKLSYHCQQFGCYARCLRLQNVLCISETCDLLKSSKLRSLVLRRVRSMEHVGGVCKLLSQNIETLVSLDFIYCNLPSAALNAICESLFTRGIQTHGIQYFSIRESYILEPNEASLPSGFLSFLSSGRALHSLHFCDSHLGPKFAETVFDTLLDASSDPAVLDLSENNISGWLSNFTGRFSKCVASSKIGKSLCSLRVLNLRGNNLLKDDADCLKYCLLQMPNLECLDISDNPIEDNGLRSLIPYYIKILERDILLFNVKMERCGLSCNGVTELLRSLSHFKGLNTLSIADNNIGSQVAVPLAEFLGQSCVKVLNIEDIEFGPSGFLELSKELPEKVKLVDINVSKNRGGIQTANFISKLILQASELVELNARYNFIPPESLMAISSALKLSKGKLEKLDLTGNAGCYQSSHAAMLAEFQVCGRPIVILPSLPPQITPHDDDP